MTSRLLAAACALSLTACGPPTADLGPAGPLVVFTFDDGHHSIYELAWPIMRAYDTAAAATHFLPATYPGQPGTVTVEQLREMEAGGWETGGHGWVHENLSSLPLDSARRMIAASDSFLTVNGLAHESYAWAFGNYNEQVQAVAAQHFRNIRTSHDLKYLDGVNRLELGAYDAKSGHTADDLIGRIEEARLSGSPLVVFCFHIVVPDTAAPDVTHDWWTRESAFRGLLAWMRGQEMHPMTVRAAVRQLCE